MAASSHQTPGNLPAAPLTATAHGSETRILIIDDMPAIHEDFRKILARVKPPALEATEASLFGSASPLTPGRKSFVLDSAFQGADGLELIQRALQSGRPYALAFIDV